MDLEEIVDDDTATGRGLVLFWVFVAVIGLALGTLVVSRGTSEPPPSSTAIDSTAQAEQSEPLPSVPEIIGLGHNLTLGYTCPAFTVGGSTLAISFEVVNFGEQDVTLLTVKPLLPKHGLKMAGNPTMGGACAEPGNDPPGGLMAPGDSRLITLRFARPVACATAGKSQQLDVTALQMVGATTRPVKSDLGLLYFTFCSTS